MTASDITVRPVATRADQEAFLALPDALFSDDPVWVPPLRMMVRDQLNPKKNPWFSHGEAQLFLAERNGAVLGRISAQVDRSHLEQHNDATGFFGFFDSVDEQPVADALFAAAGSWLKERSMSRVRGPFSLNINEESGLLVEGFKSPPRVAMGHGHPFYQKLVEKAGFEKVRDLFAFLTPMDNALPYKHMKLLQRFIDRNPGLTFRHLDLNHYDDDIRILVDLFNEAWAENWGFIPLTEADAQHMANQFKMILIPELVWFAFYEGKPAAMAVALPDLNEMIRDLGGNLWPKGWMKLAWRVLTRRAWSSGTRVPLMGVAARFKNKPLGSVLAFMVMGAIRRESLKLNMPICEMSWVLENNTQTRRSLETIGGLVYKTYRIYEKVL
ncbi:MAG: dATP pyrophosphohydrolase [Rhodospirillaceae bacterium]|nr:dATP pyrophosphohydrolase [Rhodospirillaceae bacterium]